MAERESRQAADENIIRPVVIDGVCSVVGQNEKINGRVVIDCEIDSEKNIRGYWVNSDAKKGKIRALYNYSKNEWFFGVDIGRNNLVDLSQRTADEKREIYLKSQESRKANKEAKKTFNELAKAMLEQSLTDEQIAMVMGDNPNILIDKSVGSVIIGAMIKGALEGSFKCAEFVRDTAGYKPKNEVDISADIMTDADRALIEKIDARTKTS